MIKNTSLPVSYCLVYQNYRVVNIRLSRKFLSFHKEIVDA